MNWEALTAIGSFLSAVVIGVSAFYAVRQLREIERATQFDVTDRMLSEFDAPELVAARRYVIAELPDKLRDPVYREQLARDAKLGPRAMRGAHPEIVVLDYFERLGSYMSYGFLASPVIFELVFVFLRDSRPALHEVVDTLRTVAGNPLLYDRTDELYERGVAVYNRRRAEKGL